MTQTILLADDSVTIQKVVELTFMDEDYQVVAVSNGDDAVTRIEEAAPDLVITDIHMPGANGYEVCRRAKQKRTDLPVLLLVGTFEPFNQEDVKTCGANGYLKKPFDSQELLRRVDELLRSKAASPLDAEVAPATGTVDEVAAAMLDQAVPEVIEAEPLGTEPAAPAGPRPVTEPSSAFASEAIEASSRPDEPVAAPLEAAGKVGPGPRAEPAGAAGLSDEDVERIARRLAELIGDKVVREVAWDVIPDLAEVIIKDRLRELEGQVEKL